ncbi:hypothetical protein TWF106_008287 [Orbilia oligospora]|uniref:Uncharacterized protein n=1 Tax=Orbilia oligospora TaxID=2813651 RepID=A0A7C8PVD2_ORBOL|nr:hypothetical protein TWF788_006726 [Orbilia oligospora]KAF3227883.1 hypothetical protein TWF106_008287 [Orbilia oligospora]
MTIPCRKVIVSNTEIDVAPLETVSLRLLFQNDEGERAKLYSAAKSLGFFYLDVSDSKPYLADVEQLYSITEEYFTQPEEVLLEDFRMDDEFCGYARLSL